MKWLNRLRSDPLPWLLEESSHDPGVRYLALTNYWVENQMNLR